MYEIIKRTGNTFVSGSEVIGKAETWEEAYQIGLTVCQDLANEPHKNPKGGSYWFSDVVDADEAYKIHIKKI